ncbi:MAG: hypothetical protein VYD85_13805 [Pseudomonadota bacterium]|nr:hypothetical protein [Pseudomonadota bacterium]
MNKLFATGEESTAELADETLGALSKRFSALEGLIFESSEQDALAAAQSSFENFEAAY